MVLLLMASAGTAFDWLRYGRLGVLTGLVWGSTVTAWVALRNSPPGFIQQWQHGAWGEKFTADELARLPKHDWHLLHDVAHRGGNIDHVVAGPAGLFLLDSKKYEGVVHIEGDDLVVTRDVDPRSGYRDRGILRRVRAQARALNQELRRRTGRSAWIEPAVVIWSDFPDRISKINGVTVIHGRELIAWLRSQPARSLDAAPFIDSLRHGRHRQG